MRTFDDARSALLALVPPLGAERVGIDDACGRVAAEDVRAADDAPAFDYSAMDGYAVRVADLAGAPPHRLPVRGESRTGAPAPVLAATSTCRIFTGAPIPGGADAVVMQEQVTREGDVAVFGEAPRAGANVRRRGEDHRRGDVAIARGTRLRPSHVALAAACDRAWIDVGRAPIVTIVATGDELRAPGSAATAGTIPDSNGVGLRAMARRAGAVVRVAPRAPDDRDATEAALESALRGVDVLVTVGGVSVGDHDLVRPALERIGVTIDLWRVAMKPGKPLVIGRRGATVVLGLPGNPVSALVTFALFGVPLLRALQGDRAPLPTPIRARLARPIARDAGRLEFVRATLSNARAHGDDVARAGDGDAIVATPISNQSSGAIGAMAAADALVVLPAERGAFAAGDVVDVLPMGELGA